ncbi:hypothetical protein FB451DRAFT_1470239 [Mycena latifolia]|nr:hypothetical protein FB451DRAFT_1470239 [Mycena latifolia]
MSSVDVVEVAFGSPVESSVDRQKTSTAVMENGAKNDKSGTRTHATLRDENPLTGVKISAFGSGNNPMAGKIQPVHAQAGFDPLPAAVKMQPVNPACFLTATASEDWTLVLDVCDHASANESNAKEAVHALCHEFKYGEPAAQLAAAWLWAIMLRNSSDTFISQWTSRKLLDTLKDLLTSSRTSPVVREHVMDVLAACHVPCISQVHFGYSILWVHQCLT